MIQPYSYNANSSKDLLVSSEVLVFFTFSFYFRCLVSSD
jgi:hypothetical protein